jgi:hypothetical protein
LSWFTGASAPFRFPGIVFAIATVMGLIALLTLVVMRPAPGETQDSSLEGEDLQIPPATVS